MVYFSLISLNAKLALEYNSYTGGNFHYYYYNYYLLYVSWQE